MVFKTFYNSFSICITLLCYNTTLIAQSDIEIDLKNKLQIAKTIYEKIDITNKLVHEIRNQNADSAIALGEQNIKLAEQHNYEFGTASAYIALAYANFRKGNFLLAKDYTNKALKIATKLNDNFLLGECNLSYTGVEEELGNYDVVIEKALTSIKYFEKIGNTKGIINAKLSMAQTYQVKNDLPASEKILKELLLLDIENKKTQVGVLHTLANVYGMQAKYTEAFEIDKKALLICDQNKLYSLTSSIYDNMANCYMYSGKYAKAELYFNKCLVIDGSFDNKKQMSDTYLNLGQLYQMQQNVSKSNKSLKQSIALSKATAYKPGTYQAYVLLSKNYTKNNQPDSALYAIQQGYIIKDSIINEKSENKIAELNTLYQTEKREQELALQKSKNSKKNWVLLALGVTIALLSVIGMAYIRKRNFKNKLAIQKAILLEQDIATKAIIEAEENERKRIAAELHDGVGQMMSVAKMNLSVFENELLFKNDTQRKSFEKVIHLIDDSCKEVRNVSHQMMPNALLKSGLSNALKEFILQIDTSIIKVALHAEGLHKRLAPNVETVLYRVIQECVNNVLKHANATNLDISIINDADGIAVTIEDNGKGFNTNNIENIDGIGLKNIASRINYLKGKIDYSSIINKGTIVAIHLPAQQ